MQAIYNLSAYLTHYGIQAEEEVRENFRAPTFLLAGLLFVSLALPNAGLDRVTDLKPVEDSYQDLNLSEVAAHLSARLPAAHKAESYQLARLLLQLADRHMLSPGLLLSVIETESSYRYGIVSKKGAIGLMQLLPATAREVADRYNIRDYHSSNDLYDPRVNLRVGAAYLAYLRGRFGSSVHYLAAYNMGPTALNSRLKSGNYNLGAVETYVRNIQTRTTSLRNSSSAKTRPVLGRKRLGRVLADAT
jgi:soluble lytic murein transglycosylase-like protein